MAVTARLDLVIFDAADIEQVGSFYAELTGWDVVRKDPTDSASGLRTGRRSSSSVRRTMSRRSGPDRSTRSSSTSICN